MTNEKDQEFKSVDERFVEIGASMEHARWARWQKYMHDKCIYNEDTKMYQIPRESFIHWERQILTDYKDLTEREKESDRKELK